MEEAVLLDKIRQHPDICQWVLEHGRKTEYQLYMIGRDQEAYRENEMDEATFTGYVKLPQGMGEFQMKLSPDKMRDGPLLEALLKQGMAAARSSQSPPFELAESGQWRLPQLEDPQLTENPRLTLSDLNERIVQETLRHQDVVLNCCELFLNLNRYQFRSSRGADISYRSSQVKAEIVLGGRRGDITSEGFLELQGRRVEDLSLERNIKIAATKAVDSIGAGLPESKSCPVLLGWEHFKELLMPVFYRAHGGYLFRKMSDWKIGQAITGEMKTSGDALNLAMDGTLDFGLASYSVDQYGCGPATVEVVRDNVLVNFMLDRKYSQYLGLLMTAGYGNLVVPAGQVSEQQLRSRHREFLEAVEFSHFEVDALTGNFSNEIRFGYQHRNGTATPVKGGTFSGNAFDLFRGMHLSQETVFSMGYRGPAYVLFDQGTISAQ